MNEDNTSKLNDNFFLLKEKIRLEKSTEERILALLNSPDPSVRQLKELINDISDGIIQRMNKRSDEPLTVL